MPEEKPEEIFIIVEDMPSFNGGGRSEFLKYAMKKIKYPDKARKISLEEKVYVQFVIEQKWQNDSDRGGPGLTVGATRKS